MPGAASPLAGLHTLLAFPGSAPVSPGEVARPGMPFTWGCGVPPLLPPLPRDPGMVGGLPRPPVFIQAFLTWARAGSSSCRSLWAPGPTLAAHEVSECQTPRVCLLSGDC